MRERKRVRERKRLKERKRVRETHLAVRFSKLIFLEAITQQQQQQQLQSLALISHPEPFIIIRQLHFLKLSRLINRKWVFPVFQFNKLATFLHFIRKNLFERLSRGLNYRNLRIAFYGEIYGSISPQLFLLKMM